MAQLTKNVREWPSAVLRMSAALLLSSLMSVALLIVGALHGDGTAFFYMLWNLFLAWLPPLFIVWLLAVLKRKRWSSWEGIGASLLWLVFLPNSFYLVSDLIHMQEAPSGEVLFDAVMFGSFAINGLLLGYISLYLFHREYRQRVSSRETRVTIALVLLMCSFAVYLGRDLRWNTWDVFVNPAGILFDLSDRIISPFSYPSMFVTTGVFFVMLSTFYYVLWNVVRSIRGQAGREAV